MPTEIWDQPNFDNKQQEKSNMTQGLWDGIENAKTFERGKFFQPNFDGIVCVKRTLGKETRASGMAFIVELEIETTNLPDHHPVGSKGTWFQKMIDKEVAFPSVLAWAAACLNIQTHEKDEMEELKKEIKETMKTATQSPDDNVFIDCRIRLVTTQVQTKRDKPFTRYDFSPVS